MNVASLVEVLISSELEKFLIQQFRVQNGDRLEGKVLEVRPEGKALVDFGRFRALAEVKFPVQAGETLRVRVEEKGQQLRLALEVPETLPAARAIAADGPPGRLLHLEAMPGDLPLRLGKAVEQALRQAPPDMPQPLRQALQRLAEHLQPLDPAQPAPKLAAALRQAVEGGGPFLEKRLEAAVERAIAAGVPPAPRPLAADSGVREVLQGDLKASLLRLLPLLQGEDGAAVSNPARAQLTQLADSLLEGISGQQARQAAGAESAEPHALFTFQLPLAEGRPPAKLKVYVPRRGGKRGRSGLHLALLLVLEKLGQLRTDFLLAGRQLSITFFASSARAAALLDEHLADLRAGLAGLFAALAVQVRVDEEKVAAFDTEDWPADGERLVDVRA